MHKLSLLIILLLIFATLITKIQIFTYSKPKHSAHKNSDEFKLNLKRIQTWSLICLIGMSVIYLNGLVFTLALISLSVWALIELSRLFNVTLNLYYYLLIAATLFSFTFIAKQLQEFQIALFVLPMVTLIFALVVPPKIPSIKQASFIAMLLFCVISINSLNSIAQLDINRVDPRFLVLFLCFITAINDIAQYVFGKMFGRIQLAPTVSPSKTLEGALGGVVVTGVIVGFVFSKILSIHFLLAFFIGAFISVLGIMGDLSFSHYKRQAKVKNSGQSLPGHGGLLDRIDSLMLTAPGFGLCLKLIN